MRGRIMKGELKPGQRLTEEWLAAELGVSRIPVRETIRALASEGFVRSEHYGRTFVATLDAQAGHDLLDVRAVLEPLAAANIDATYASQGWQRVVAVRFEAAGPAGAVATAIKKRRSLTSSSMNT